MSKDKWKKRYSFRLTADDEDIYNFLESSKQTNSETIRQLLKFALNQINQEKKKQQENKQFSNILNELHILKEQQDKGFKEIMDKLNSGEIMISENGNRTHEDIDKEIINKSVENSIDSMLMSFGINE